MREYQTNKLHLKFDYETIERDFDIYQIKQKAEGKKYISQEVLDNVSEEQYITAVQWIYGNTALVLLEKDKISTYAFKKKMRERWRKLKSIVLMRLMRCAVLEKHYLLRYV